MKTYLPFIATISLLPVFSVSAENIDQQQPQTDVLTSIFHAGIITQSFVPSNSELTAIQLHLTDNSTSAVDAGEISISLYQGSTSSEVIATTETVVLEDCFNSTASPGCGIGGGYSIPIQFDFSDIVSLTEGELYTFKLNMESGTSVSIAFSSSDTYGSGEFYRNGELQAGDLAFTTFAPEEPSFYVSSKNEIYQYSYAGDVLKKNVVSAASLTAVARDLVHFPTNEIAVFNGVFEPTLSLYNGTWQHHSIEGWSIINNVGYGGLAADDKFYYLGDMSTSGDGSPKGLVRLTRDFTSSERFFESYEFIDVTLGEDGYLYALRNHYGDLVIIEPSQMTIVSEIDLGHTSSSRAVTADSEGNIYLASWTGVISQYDRLGNVINSAVVGGSLTDIDLQGDKILLGTRSGDVHLLTLTFEVVNTFNVSSSTTFTSFSAQIPSKEVPTPIPEIEAEVQVNNDWGSGYCATLVVTNNTEEKIIWDVEVAVEGNINNLWNGNWSQEGSTLNLRGLSWNNSLQAGESNSSIGFCASK